MRYILFSILFITSTYAHAQMVSTIAGGGGSNGFTNDTGRAARFYNPNGIAIDKTGNILVADQNNHVIRKITPAGTVSTFAGDGTAGMVNGAAGTAQFNAPWGITIDTAGNIYVGDAGNNLIRKISTTGIVSTYAGTGDAGFADGAALSAMFDYPSNIASDKEGNIYVGDYDNHSIRKISTSGIVTTIAGKGIPGAADGHVSVASLYGPSGIVVTESGNIFFTEINNHRVRMIRNDTVMTVAGGSMGDADGTGIFASFNAPHGLLMDHKTGDLLVADCGNSKVKRVTVKGVVTTVAGSTPGYKDGKADTAQFNTIKCLAQDKSGAIVLTDEQNHTIRKITFKESTTSINGPSAEPVLSLRPNPAHNSLYIEGTVTGKQAVIRIFNISGQMVLQQSVQVNNHLLQASLDISVLQNGNYSLELLSDNMKTSKIIVKY
jgi:sugar lactone lactonase YvrE